MQNISFIILKCPSLYDLNILWENWDVVRLNCLFLSIPEYKYIHIWHMVELKHAISYVNARRVLNIKSLTATSTVSFYSSFIFQLISQMAILMPQGPSLCSITFSLKIHKSSVSSRCCKRQWHCHGYKSHIAYIVQFDGFMLQSWALSRYWGVLLSLNIKTFPRVYLRFLSPSSVFYISVCV